MAFNDNSNRRWVVVVMIIAPDGGSCDDSSDRRLWPLGNSDSKFSNTS